MKLQRTTLILLVLALGLGSFIYFYEIQGAQQREAEEANQKQLFSFPEAAVQTLQVATPEATIRFVRVPKLETPEAKPDSQDPTSPDSPPQPKSLPQPQVWQMQVPKTMPANDATVTYLLNLLATSQRDRRFEVTSDQLVDYGLAQPQATVTVTLQDQTVHRLVLGGPNFNDTLLYALVDPPPIPEAEPITLEAVLIPTTFEYAAGRPLEEWEKPADLPTEADAGARESPNQGADIGDILPKP